MPEPSVTTRSLARKMSALDHMLRDVMGFSDDDLMIKAIEANGFRAIEDITTLSDTNIDVLKIPDGDAQREIPVHICNMFRILKAWKVHLTSTHGVSNFDWTDGDIINRHEWN